MKWYHYIACFFAGLFLANTVPHFVHGVSGESFPTPFCSSAGQRFVVADYKRCMGVR